MRGLDENIRSVSTILLSVVLLVSVSGVELRFHTCSTSGNTDYIATLPLFDQNFDASDFNCQCAPVDTKISHCEKCMIDSSSSDEDGCCDSGAEFLILELEYLAQTAHQVDDPKVIELFAVATSFLFDDYTDEFIDYSINEDDPPPLPDTVGRYFIISHNQLKIPTA